MLIWINLYFLGYIGLIMTLHCLLNGIYGNNFNKKSLLFVHFFMIKYTKIKYLYLFTILSLAGLPPFLVKNITYSKNLIFNIIVILFIMLLGTIFVSDLYFLGTLFLL